MTSTWCNLEQAAEILAISRDKLREAIEDSRKAGIVVPATDHATPGSRAHALRFCIPRLDAWMLEVGQWRIRESSQAASGKSDGESQEGAAPKASRRSARATSSSQPSSSAKSSGSPIGPNRKRLRLLRSQTA